MTLRDLSFWGIVKATLFVTALLPLIALALVLPFYLLGFEQVSFNQASEEAPKIFGIMGFKMTGIPQWITFLLVGILNLLVASKVLQLIARLTPIGHIVIGPADRSEPTLPNTAPALQP